ASVNSAPIRVRNLVHEDHGAAVNPGQEILDCVWHVRVQQIHGEVLLEAGHCRSENGAFRGGGRWRVGLCGGSEAEPFLDAGGTRFRGRVDKSVKGDVEVRWKHRQCDDGVLRAFNDDGARRLLSVLDDTPAGEVIEGDAVLVVATGRRTQLASR